MSSTWRDLNRRACLTAQSVWFIRWAVWNHYHDKIVQSFSCPTIASTHLISSNDICLWVTLDNTSTTQIWHTILVMNYDHIFVYPHIAPVTFKRWAWIGSSSNSSLRRWWVNLLTVLLHKNLIHTHTHICNYSERCKHQKTSHIFQTTPFQTSMDLFGILCSIVWKSAND